MKMNNRVYGVVGIKSIMSNWNADFTGRPKTISTGDIFGSDKAFKYPIKRMWQAEGEKVLYIKSYKIDQKGKKDDKEKLQPRDLNERYEQIFGTKLNNDTSSKEVLSNLFSAIDVMNFGATFAEKKQNISITGAVQVGQGFNKYKDSNIETQDILSPFRNSSDKKEDSTASSLGTKTVTDEAHYFYPFSVNPQNYNDYMELGIDGFEGYTKEAYEKFKKGCLIAATAFNTNSKAGCENEFAIFIVCKEHSELYLANIDRYIDFRKEDGKNKISLYKLNQLLDSKMDQIESIEMYYNELDLEVDICGLPCTINNLY
ncbi:type I CRISPR-associated protein Cas7 [Xylanivirga thermophila]|jgi:CRISPR-associated protein Csh2|uniref:type I CRISPR-associated protein Cas7 n=1 Tax=Xylanivirga thermophila TaxID=2496273 RepID=UPI00101D0350|nr:type I CRISPR-associated protein Cas7 [Xylanivirga thermophila]